MPADIAAFCPHCGSTLDLSTWVEFLPPGSARTEREPMPVTTQTKKPANDGGRSSPYHRFVSAGRKAGRSMKELNIEWRARQNGGELPARAEAEATKATTTMTAAETDGADDEREYEDYMKWATCESGMSHEEAGRRWRER